MIKTPSEVDETLAPCPHFTKHKSGYIRQNILNLFSKARGLLGGCGVNVGVTAFLGHVIVCSHHHWHTTENRTVPESRQQGIARKGGLPARMLLSRTPLRGQPHLLEYPGGRGELVLILRQKSAS